MLPMHPHVYSDMIRIGGILVDDGRLRSKMRFGWMLCLGGTVDGGVDWPSGIARPKPHNSQALRRSLTHA